LQVSLCGIHTKISFYDSIYIIATGDRLKFPARLGFPGLVFFIGYMAFDSAHPEIPNAFGIRDGNSRHETGQTICFNARCADIKECHQ
jgi:hypothetical protein